MNHSAFSFCLGLCSLIGHTSFTLKSSEAHQSEKRMFRYLFCAGIVLFLTGIALSQTPDTSTLRGEVLDQTGAAVPSVSITVTNTLTGLTRSAQADDRGRFSFAGL